MFKRQRTANAIFDDWEVFARYGFNIAHAADYCVKSEQTAFLKANFPSEYMTAMLTAERDDTDKLSTYVADARRMGIEVLPPDVNDSELDFHVQESNDGKNAGRFGLGAVKNVGEGAVIEILRARSEHGSFNNLDDFCTHVDLRKVGKRALDSLVKVGALDMFEERNKLLGSIEQLVGASSAIHKAKEVGQISMFDILPEDVGTAKIDLVDDVDDFSPKQLRKFEKDLSPESREILLTNPLRILDSKSPKDIEISKNAPEITNLYSSDSKKKFEDVQALLNESNMSFVVDNTLVRGLDYYCHTVFEFKNQNLGTQDTCLLYTSDAADE